MCTLLTVCVPTIGAILGEPRQNFAILYRGAKFTFWILFPWRSYWPANLIYYAKLRNVRKLCQLQLWLTISLLYLFLHNSASLYKVVGSAKFSNYWSIQLSMPHQKWSNFQKSPLDKCKIRPSLACHLLESTIYKPVRELPNIDSNCLHSNHAASNIAY